MKYMLIAAAALPFLACNNIEIALIPNTLTQPQFMPAMTGQIGGTCTVAAGDPEMALPTVHLNNDSRFVGFVTTANGLASIDTNVAMQAALDFDLPNEVIPLRFDYRWECEDSAFGLGRGPLVLPEFNATLPFCFDERQEGSEFVGFDVTSATGPSIAPGEEAIVSIEIVSPVLADSMAGTFQLASDVEACCRSPGVRCDNPDSGADRTTGPCQVAQAQFDRLAPDTFDVGSSEDLNRFRVLADIAPSQPYRMRFNGRIEGVTSDGDLVTSTLFARMINFDINSVFSNPCNQ